MTTIEFSNEFDILLNSYSNFSDKPNQISLRFDEYEKSLFLTHAQEDLVISLYNGKNKSGESFEVTEELRRYLSSLVKTEVITNKQDNQTGVSKNSVFFKLPEDLMFITYESIDIEDEQSGCINGRNINILPITQDDYFRIKENPFKGPNNRRALRLDINNGLVEIISKYNVNKYLIRYLSKPSPIILEDLPDDLSIDNINKKTECKLNPALHRIILERAVKNALLSKSIAGK